MRNLNSEQLQTYLQAKPDLLLLDVREKWEFDICHISNSENMPMGSIPDKTGELDSEKETIVICHHGARSLQVAHFLENNGFNNVVNLDGGIDAWARIIDPNMAQY
jgi:rhodanese-related sulfurtransferase